MCVKYYSEFCKVWNDVSLRGKKLKKLNEFICLSKRLYRHQKLRIKFVKVNVCKCKIELYCRLYSRVSSFEIYVASRAKRSRWPSWKLKVARKVTNHSRINQSILRIVCSPFLSHIAGLVLWASFCEPCSMGLVLWVSFCGPRSISLILWASCYGPCSMGLVL